MSTKTITNILINNHHYKLEADTVTGLELKQLAGIPSENMLFREARGHGDDEPIDDHATITVRDGDRFYDMPPGNFG